MRIYNMGQKIFVLLMCFLMLFSIVNIQGNALNAFDNTNEVYSITYHLDGGTNAVKNPDVYTEEDTITLKDASKVGYDFAGWFLDANKTEQITEICMMGNVDVYAKFIPKSYTATFNDNGANQSSPLKVTLNDSIGNTETYTLTKSTDSVNPYLYWIPTREGYVFAGWYNGNELVPEKLEITSDLVLKAKWTKCSMHEADRKFAIFGDNTSIVSSDGWTYFYRQKYEWSTAEYLANDVDSYSSGNGWSYIYVYVNGKYKTLNYEGKAGSYYYGENVLEDKYARFEVYDLTNQKILIEKGDYSSAYKTVAGSFEVEPGSILRIGVGYFISHSHLTPLWGEIKISLGETRTSSIRSAHERTTRYEFDSYINPPSVSKTGYKFLGWYDYIGNQMTDTWQYTEDQNFTAKWQPIKYTIDYNLNGGINSSSNPSSYTIEDSITLKNPTKPGYTFKGWYSDEKFTTKVTAISKKQATSLCMQSGKLIVIILHWMLITVCLLLKSHLLAMV